jgi:ribulose-bisphosphate carboxylase large chain
MTSDPADLQLSGERFTELYRIQADNEAAAIAHARAICLEQTVEFPWTLIPNAAIRT